MIGAELGNMKAEDWDVRDDGSVHDWTGKDCPRCNGVGKVYEETGVYDVTCKGCGGTGEEYGLVGHVSTMPRPGPEPSPSALAAAAALAAERDRDAALAAALDPVGMAGDNAEPTWPVNFRKR